MKSRISELPDDVMSNILSRLGLKDAAKTSILSKRWRYSWTLTDHLDFYPSSLTMFPFHGDGEWYLRPLSTFCPPYQKCCEYQRWVNQVLSAHRGPCINKFRVVFHCNLGDSSDFARWVRFALSKRVNELVLDLQPAGWCGEPYYTLGFDILNHPPCDVGISSLKSLDLIDVRVSGRFLEFILLRCCLLERLFVDGSDDIVNLKVMSCKLKHFGIKRCKFLQGIEVDAVNLIKFQLEDYGMFSKFGDGKYVPHLVFKNVPSLVEAEFGGECTQQTYPLLRMISCFSMQLSRLCLTLNVRLERDWTPEFHTGGVTCFPNVKHLELRVECYQDRTIDGLLYFIEACPMLYELKLKLNFQSKIGLGEEATLLQKVDRHSFEDDKQANNELLEKKQHCEPQNRLYKNHIMGIDMATCERLWQKYRMNTHTKLKVMELIGFEGCHVDVRFVLCILDSYATSLESIVRDHRGFNHTYWNDDEIETCRNRARKLAKVVVPKVKVIIR